MVEGLIVIIRGVSWGASPYLSAKAAETAESC
jgi:hypothetical protein